MHPVCPTKAFNKPSQPLWRSRWNRKPSPFSPKVTLNLTIILFNLFYKTWSIPPKREHYQILSTKSVILIPKPNDDTTKTTTTTTTAITRSHRPANSKMLKRILANNHPEEARLVQHTQIRSYRQKNLDTWRKWILKCSKGLHDQSHDRYRYDIPINNRDYIQLS